MVLKRQFVEGGDEGSRESKRRASSSIRDASWPQEAVTKLEPMLRVWIREEVERAIFSSPRLSLNQIESSKTRKLQLYFDDKLPSTIFTNSKIRSEDNKKVKIVLCDSSSKRTITSGPLSSMKIKVVVLHGDFNPDDQEDWSRQDFNMNIASEREGKRPLVTGNLIIILRDGIGYIDEITFTDNSSWTRCGKFRLGVQAQGEASIREGMSRAFKVKDHRGESYKKHHPPSLADEVWRLEKIAKDGVSHKQLASNGIHTVKDFLRFYNVDPSFLRTILGNPVSKKSWETIIHHASTCVLNDREFFMYKSTECITLVFNSIFKLVGAILDGQNYQLLENLSSFHKNSLEAMKGLAYKNLKGMIPVDGLLVAEPQLLLCSQQDDSPSSASLSLQNLDFPIEEDQLEAHKDSEYATGSFPYTYGMEDNQLEVYGEQYTHQMQGFNSTSRMSDSCDGLHTGEYSWVPSASVDALLLTDHFVRDNNFQTESSPWQRNGYFATPSNEGVAVVSSNFGIRFPRKGPKASWSKVLAAIKWRILVRRNVAARRWQKFSNVKF